MLLLFQLDRKNVLPVGDLGVRKGMMQHFGLKQLPSTEQMAQLANRWQPYRSVGAFLMWRLQDLAKPPKPARSA